MTKNQLQQDCSLIEGILDRESGNQFNGLTYRHGKVSSQLVEHQLTWSDVHYALRHRAQVLSHNGDGSFRIHGMNVDGEKLVVLVRISRGFLKVLNLWRE